MKKCLTAGIVFLLPFFLTMAIVVFLINFLTNPFLFLVEDVLVWLGLIHKHTHEKSVILVHLIVKILILLFLFGFTVMFGFLANRYLFDANLADRLFGRIPYINKFYKACHELVHRLFSPSLAAESKVVIVPFPHQNKSVIGFVTSDLVKIEQTGRIWPPYAAVYIPAALFGSAGYLLLLKKEQLYTSTMNGEEGMKFVLSCGTLITEGTAENHAS